MEYGTNRGVTVDTLDHFTRCVSMVEIHVEIEAVMRKVVTHFVGGAPADVLAKVGADDLYALANDANGEEGNACPDKVFGRSVSLCRVDKVANNLGIEQVEANAGKHEYAEPDDTFPIGAEILGK